MVNNSLGTYLRELREQAGLSQRATGLLVSCSNTYIRNLERGGEPSPRFLLKLVNALEGDFDEAWDLYKKLLTAASIAPHSGHIGVTSDSGMP